MYLDTQTVGAWVLHPGLQLAMQCSTHSVLCCSSNFDCLLTEDGGVHRHGLQGITLGLLRKILCAFAAMSRTRW